MSLPKQLTDGIYQALTSAPPGNKAIVEVMDNMHTSYAIEIFAAVVQNPKYESLSDEEMIALIDPIFEQAAEDFNEILKPYNVEVAKWDCRALAKRVKYDEGVAE